jgi:hypothetical protein
MVTKITKTVNGQTVPFLFGTRALKVLCDQLKIKGLQEFSLRFSDPGFEEIAALLYAGHENACFYDKATPLYGSVDDMYTMIDELGITECATFITVAIQSFIGDTGNQKKKK